MRVCAGGCGPGELNSIIPIRRAAAEQGGHSPAAAPSGFWPRGARGWPPTRESGRLGGARSRGACGTRSTKLTSRPSLTSRGGSHLVRLILVPARGTRGSFIWWACGSSGSSGAGARARPSQGCTLREGVTEREGPHQRTGERGATAIPVCSGEHPIRKLRDSPVSCAV